MLLIEKMQIHLDYKHYYVTIVEVYGNRLIFFIIKNKMKHEHPRTFESSFTE